MYSMILNRFRFPVALLFTASYFYTNFENGQQGVENLRRILSNSTLTAFVAGLSAGGGEVMKMFTEPFSWLPMLVLLAGVFSVCLFLTNLGFEAFYVVVDGVCLCLSMIMSPKDAARPRDSFSSFVWSRLVPLGLAYALYLYLAYWCGRYISLPVVFPLVLGA